MQTTDFRSFAEFYPYYLSEHSNSTNRALHFAGTTGVIALAVTATLTMQPLLLLGMPVCGYGFAWVGHFMVEHNRPATFTYPRWSLMGDFRMYFEIWRGLLGGQGVVIPQRSS